MDEVDEARRHNQFQRDQALSFEYIVYAVFSLIVAVAVLSVALLGAIAGSKII